MTGAKEIRIYLIKDDNELLFNTVSFFLIFHRSCKYCLRLL